MSRVATVTLLGFLIFAACRREEPLGSGALRQRGYLWQREWRPAVADAVLKARGRLDGIVVLGAEIEWQRSEPSVRRASVDWRAIAASRISCGIGLRVAPFAGPFEHSDASAAAIVHTAKSLIEEARANEVEANELQLDFDCAQRSLAGYQRWVEAVRAAIQPTRMVITVLPSWLDEEALPRLLRAADGYVLQVHSVPLGGDGETALCDTKVAKRWVAKAAALGRPFSVVLPTYRCVAGYSETGKLLGVVMDSVQPTWPHGTRMIELSANADELAGLVRDWTDARPAQLQELLWYRVPIATDARNWRWPTLAAVMSGRAPKPELQVEREGNNPVDLSIRNIGEAEAPLHASIITRWSDAPLLATEALPGWQVRTGNGRAEFSTVVESPLRLPPGERRQIGWLRFEKPVMVASELQKRDVPLR